MRAERPFRPEIKILLYVALAASLFLFEDLRFYIGTCAVLCVLFLRVPFKRLKAGWVPITLFLVFTFLSNLFYRHGRIVFSSGGLVITSEGIESAVLKTLRLLIMIGGVKVLMAASKAEEIVDGLGNLLSPLERIGVPVKDFFHTMALTVRCFPALKEKAAETYRKTRSLSDERGFSARVKAVSAFLMPMFVESIRTPEAFFGKTEDAE